MELNDAGAATDAETTTGPLSPELILVSPELRELALRELALPYKRNGVKQHSDLLNLAHARAFDRNGLEHGSPPQEASLLRAAGAAGVRTAVLAALFVIGVGCAAFGLTIAPGETPELGLPNPGEARQPVERAWRSTLEARPAPQQPAPPAIGSAVVSRPQSVVGLTGYSRLVWNLNALVRDVFGDQPVCLLRASNQLSPAACSASPQARAAYRTTFTSATGSDLRLGRRKGALLLQGRAVPLRLRTSYISCGPQRWVAAAGNWALSCERERSKRRR